MDNLTLTPDVDAASSTGEAGSMGSTGEGAQDKTDKVSDPAPHTEGCLSSAAHQTMDKIACSAANVTHRFSDKVHRISEMPPLVLASSKSWIQEKPLQAVGIALAVGYLMGRRRSY